MTTLLVCAIARTHGIVMGKDHFPMACVSVLIISVCRVKKANISTRKRPSKQAYKITEVLKEEMSKFLKEIQGGQ